MGLCNLALYVVEPLLLLQINVSHAGDPNTTRFCVPHVDYGWQNEMSLELSYLLNYRHSLSLLA